MGAQTFENHGKGRSAKEVFLRIREESQYEHGHGGYTGTIAEKGSFKEVQLPEGRELGSFMDELLESRFSDKWGDAGCICIKPPEPIKPLNPAEAERLAKEKFGSTATVEVKRSGGEAVAQLFTVSKGGGMGVNVPVPGGYKNAKKTVNAPTADEARGALFAEDGEWVFFGWASS